MRIEETASLSALINNLRPPRLEHVVATQRTLAQDSGDITWKLGCSIFRGVQMPQKTSLPPGCSEDCPIIIQGMVWSLLVVAKVRGFP